MNPEQYNLLVNLVQAGLQKITDEAAAALQSVQPQDEPTTEEAKEPVKKKT